MAKKEKTNRKKKLKMSTMKRLKLSGSIKLLQIIPQKPLKLREERERGEDEKRGKRKTVKERINFWRIGGNKRKQLNLF